MIQCRPSRLFVSQRAERMERLLENADNRERRVGRDFDAKFRTRQASTVLPPASDDATNSAGTDRGFTRVGAGAVCRCKIC